jgi:hypothetical protein
MVPSLSTIATMTNSTIPSSSQSSASSEQFSTFALGGIIIAGFIFIFALAIGIRYKYLQTAKTVKVLSSRSVELVTLGEKNPGSNRSATASICSSKSAAETTFDEIYGSHDIECGLTQINLQSLSYDLSSFPDYVQPSLSRPNSNSSKVGDNQDQNQPCSETSSLEASSLSTDLNEEVEENNPIDDYQLEEGLGIASCSPTTTRKSANSPKRTTSACSKGRPPINSLSPSSPSPPLPYYLNKNPKDSQSSNGSGRSSPSENNSQKQLRSCNNSRKDSSDKQLRFLIDDMMHKPPSRDELEDSFTMIEHDGGGDFGMDGGYMSLKTTSTGSEDSVGIWIKMKDEREGIVFPVIDLNVQQIFK